MGSRRIICFCFEGGSIAFVTTLALFTSVYVQFCGSSGRGSPNCRCYWSEVRTAMLGEANEPKQNKLNLLILIRRYCCLMQWSTAVVETIKGRDEGEPLIHPLCR